MKSTIDQYIGIYEDVYPEGYCDHLISEFDRLVSGGAGANRQQSEGALKHQKNDHQLGLQIKHHNSERFDGKDVVDMFFDGLQRCYDHYAEMFSTLKTSGSIRATHMKMQRTPSGGGYHVWHHEQGGGESSHRAVVYMLYLNSLAENEAGETEFLYQQKRISPKANTMVVWPASYTHAHRGNPVFGEKSKYIVTGWFYYD